MPSTSTLALDGPLASIALPPSGQARRPSWATLASGVLSVALIVAILHQTAGLHLADARRLLPISPAFWIAFAGYYLATPVSEWLIFRRLWNIPGSGLFALVRKKLYNELLLGYLGEAYFYGWARRRVAMTAAPFGAVKDVAILSAMAGNLVTLLLLVAVWPMVGVTQLGLDSHLVVWSLAIILVVSLAATLLRRRVFSLPRRELGYVMAMHLARIGATVVLSALLWHLALPGVALVWWLFLATLRMLVSRLPLVPNKDLVFAGVAVFTLGHEQDIAGLMALIAALVLGAHMFAGAMLVLRELVAPDPES